MRNIKNVFVIFSEFPSNGLLIPRKIFSHPSPLIFLLRYKSRQSVIINELERINEPIVDLVRISPNDRELAPFPSVRYSKTG